MAHIQIDDLGTRITYDVGATPSTGPFTIPFAFFAVADLRVYNGETLLTLTTDYTVAGTAVDAGFSGGTFSLVSPVSNTAIALIRRTQKKRTSDFPNSGPLSIPALNTDLDRLTAITQEIGEEFERSLTLSEEETDGEGAYDANGNRLSNLGEPLGATDAVRLTDLEAAQIAAGNVPLPQLADIGRVLKATALGVFGWVAETTSFLASQIGDFGEAVDDRVDALLAVGSGLAKAYNDSGNLLSLSVTSGSVINSAYAEYTANADLTAVIPSDDTIPQISEGTQILSISLTPSSTTSKLRIRFRASGTVGAAQNALTAALFTNGGANAVRSDYVINSGADFEVPLWLEYEYTPGSVAAQTLAIRVGPSGGTMRLNGTSTARRLGGTMAATLVVEEIKA